MLLSEESLTNSRIGRRLNVSQAAVTKAIGLWSGSDVGNIKDSKDARVIFFYED